MDMLSGNVFFQVIFRIFFHVFYPTVFAFASAGSALQALGAAERAGDEAVTKGGNRKGIPLTRDFFAVVFSFTGFGFLWARFLVFRVSLGVRPEKASHLTKEKQE